MTFILMIARTGGPIISSLRMTGTGAESHLESLRGVERHQSQQCSVPGRRLSAAAWARGAAQKWLKPSPSIVCSEQTSLINGVLFLMSQNASPGPRQPPGRAGPTDITYLPLPTNLLGCDLPTASVGRSASPCTTEAVSSLQAGVWSCTQTHHGPAELPYTPPCPLPRDLAPPHSSLEPLPTHPTPQKMASLRTPLSHRTPPPPPLV